MKSKETKKIEIKGGKNIRETIDLKKKWEVELRRGNWRKREERKNNNAMRFRWWWCRRRQSGSRGTGPAASNALHKLSQEEEGR